MWRVVLVTLEWIRIKNNKSQEFIVFALFDSDQISIEGRTATFRAAKYSTELNIARPSED